MIVIIDSGPNWADSYTKLLAFNQTQYSRLIAIDSDSLLLGSLDELFFVPPAAAVMPRAYWLSTPTMTSHVMVLTPSTDAFHRVHDIIESRAGYGFYDMEIMNRVFGGTCEVIPHEPYALLTGEFTKADHAAFLGSLSGHAWNPKDVLRQARLVHFSDSPLSKPWLATDEKILAAKPDCSFHAELGQECRAQEIWLDFYKRFREKRNVSDLSLETGIDGLAGILSTHILADTNAHQHRAYVLDAASQAAAQLFEYVHDECEPRIQFRRQV